MAANRRGRISRSHRAVIPFPASCWKTADDARAILYLDTSALVKLYIVESHSPAVHAAVATADTVAVCRIAWAEACAALARRAREVPTDDDLISAARQALTQDWPHFFLVEVSQAVVERAGDFAETFALRGYDSVKLAAACEILAVGSDSVAFACFDNRLNKAAALLGLDIPLSVPV